jgi:glycine hydroxymethyltransferase
VCFAIAMTEPYREYQRAVKANAAALAEGIAAHGGELLTGGTDTHLVQLDLRRSELSGKDMEERLHDVLITVNRNTVPYDERPPTIASGVRVGTPAATMRGLDESDAREVGAVIGETIRPDADLSSLRARIASILARRPLYASMTHGAPAGAGTG